MMNNLGPDGQWFVVTASPTTKATDDMALLLFHVEQFTRGEFGEDQP